MKWPELGMPESLWCMKVKEFGPLIVSIDTEGRNLIAQNKALFNEKKGGIVKDILPKIRLKNPPPKAVRQTLFTGRLFFALRYNPALL